MKIETGNDIKDGKKVSIKISIDIDITNFAHDVFLNLPEYSISLKCIDFNYKELKFKFYDDDGIEHEIDREKAEKGIEKFLNNCLHGTFGDPNLKNPTYLFDIGCWDAYITDMAIQTCIFGEVIYG